MAILENIMATRPKHFVHTHDILKFWRVSKGGVGGGVTKWCWEP